MASKKNEPEGKSLGKTGVSAAGKGKGAASAKKAVDAKPRPASSSKAGKETGKAGGKAAKAEKTVKTVKPAKLEKAEKPEKPVSNASVAETAAPEKGPVKKAVKPAKKICRIISFEKMTPEIKALFDARYPDGYADYVNRYPKPSGESFYAVSLYTDDADYLVKVDVDVDLSIDVDYDFPEPAPEDDVAADTMDEEKSSPDVNDLADSLADEPSENL